MGILANTVSMWQYRVAGQLPTENVIEWIGQCLGRHAFRPIDDMPVESSLGWVHLDDQQATDFSLQGSYRRDHYMAFSMRQDNRRIPGALLKAYRRVAEYEYLQANPGLSRVPKTKREEIQDAVRLSLLTKTLPVPAVYDVVWDLEKSVVTFTALSAKIIEQFETLFKKTFEGARLVAIHPYSRAAQLAGEDLLPELLKANRATTESAMDLIRANQWIGWDFLSWLMYRTMNDDARSSINQPGHAAHGEPYTSYLNDRVVLLSAGEQGVQKVTVAGPQDHFGEVRNALGNSKKITEATIYLEKDEHTWRLTLKGELFQFGSFRSPAVKIEKDDSVDQQSEREAVFYERMYLLEQGLQIFDSLFFDFLKIRLGPEWQMREGAIRQWASGEAS